MNDTTSSPSRLLKITAVTARWLLGLLVAAWLVFALSVAVLHGWIVPRIDQYRGLLEAQAGRALGVPVAIGAVAARSDGLFPTLELRDVVLRDAQQREALRLERVVASVSPRSLWRLGFEQLYLERPQLEMRLDPQGRLHVAGLDVSGGTTSDGRATEWLLSQREFAVRGGTVRWIDERRGAPPLLLADVDFVARHAGRRHALRLDATPPPGWGERFSLRGLLRQPLLAVHGGRWQTWSGVLYAELPAIDVSRLGQYVTLDARIREGRGALRVWVDMAEGSPAGGAADLALASVDASLAPDLEPLALRAVRGRVALRRTDRLLEVSTTGLQFDQADGRPWPGGDLWFKRTSALGRTPERGELRAARLDLAALAQIAGRLPLGPAARDALAAWAPRGLVERIDASWQGPAEAPSAYRARGRVSGLQLASQPAVEETAAAPAPAPAGPPATASRRGAPAQNPAPASSAGRPGVRGATVDFDASQDGGTATLGIAQGALDLPGVFEEPVIPVDRLAGELQWRIDGPRWQVRLRNLRFANADAEGSAQIDWRTGEAGGADGRGRFPGLLDLQGQLTRADGTRVFRYLPLHVPKHVRDYVRDGVTRGTASVVDFRVRGDLHDMPFMDPRQGEFRIAAKVANVTFDYVPHAAAAAGSAAAAPRWPALERLSGELVFERAGMQVLDARGRVAGASDIEVGPAQARIADMSHHAALLQVEAQARGPLDQLLRVAAPLAGPASGLAARARASGSADYRLKLDLPLGALEQARVQASVALGGNELQVVPEAPAFTQAHGTLHFTETGFALDGVQARLAGGEVRVEGKGRYGGGPASSSAAAAGGLDFSARGSFTAEGLRAARELAWLTPFARKASGGASYVASLSLQGGTPEFTFSSSLQGLALQLPEPLAKAAADSLPLRIEKKTVQRAARADAAGPAALQDRIALELGAVASASYVRDISTDAARVLRGSIAVGLPPDESAAAPERGVRANLNLGRLDVDAWQALFGEVAGAAPGAAPAAPAGTRRDAATVAEGARGYLPDAVALRAQELSLAGRKLRNVVLGGSREGSLWRANIDAGELDGYVEYREAGGGGDGRLYARLAHLRIEPGTAGEVESVLDAQPEALPALDIVVEDFELLGKRLGRAEVEAVNRGGPAREWRLNRLAFRTPEAAFEARGSWATPAAAPRGGPAAPRGGVARHTAMDFRLDIADAGALLARLGMPGVVRGGHGRLAGTLDWRGSPFSLDQPSLGGQLNIEVEQGQFLKADPGLAKLLGVLSLQALPRRLTLDFRDVFSQGFAFDFIRGDAAIAAGVARTNNLQMKGVNAAVLMDGSADLAHETQDLHVVIVPQIDAGTAALVATAINPAIGVATFLAQMVLRQPLVAVATQQFRVDGTWSDPRITRLPRRAAPASADSTSRKEVTQ